MLRPSRRANPAPSSCSAGKTSFGFATSRSRRLIERVGGWALFNLLPETTELDAGVPKQAKLANGAVQGLNDFPNHGYDGPYPPPGKPHRYFFKVFALDAKLNLTEKARKSDLLKAMQGISSRRASSSERSSAESFQGLEQRRGVFSKHWKISRIFFQALENAHAVSVQNR
ncbi:MAG: YbhB/YbcL family Raf kinase inhibitor-like protein [Kiritimatiellaeota bacterium]|nr:YbhB/YbcL family Raf kinase inhibitor-like protein [Kiritimatiellota bacterium]